MSDLSKGTISVSLAASLIVGAVSVAGSYFTTVGRIDVLAQRISTLEGASDKDMQNRVGSLERKMEEIANVRNVGEWNQFRGTTTQLLQAHDRTLMELQSRVHSLETRR